MTSLKENIIHQIETQGPLTVAEYMDFCLTDPAQGYYTTRDPLGMEGDFITAPEISQMFGELLGLWMADRWQQMGAPASVIVAELGPGRGTLMADALRASKVVPGFRDALEVHFIEVSPILRASQANMVEGLSVSARWHNSVSTLPRGPLLLIANEFFDALGIRQYERLKNGCAERYVGIDKGQLHFQNHSLKGAPDELDKTLLARVETGEIIEFCPSLAPIISEISKQIAAHGGAALIIDYGYSDDLAGDSFQAVKNHDFANPLENPGNADLTAHVNFAALARTASDAGVRVVGPVTQASFLCALGIEARAIQLKEIANSKQQTGIDSALTRLTGTDQMGRLFKVMGLLASDFETAPGFEGGKA